MPNLESTVAGESRFAYSCFLLKIAEQC